MKHQIQYVTGLHGNEPIPVLALAYLGIPQIVANPPALSINKRYIDMDMNKAFGTKGNSQEEQLARQILTKINSDNFIIDLHTCSAITEPFTIVTDLQLLSFAKTLGLKHIVFMKHNIKSGHALIDFCKGVSVEVGIHNTYEAFSKTIELVNNASTGVQKSAEIYEVYDIIKKPGKYLNFQKHPQGFIPVLAGEQAYDFYGLKARILSI